MAHTLHLIIKDVLRYDRFTSAVDNSLKVTKYYYLSHHHPKAILETCMTAIKAQCRKHINITGDKRWGSNFRIIDAASNARQDL